MELRYLHLAVIMALLHSAEYALRLFRRYALTKAMPEERAASPWRGE
jgi:hypothetical protein